MNYLLVKILGMTPRKLNIFNNPCLFTVSLVKSLFSFSVNYLKTL